MGTENKKRRIYGQHLTPIQIFKKFILPEIKDKLWDYIWVDLFAGEGNLILPILELIPKKDQTNFFENHIFLFDVQKNLVESSIKKAMDYGIPEEIARRNIKQRDTIRDYPKYLTESELPVYHITNPPYLYIGYIVKNKATQKYLAYFEGPNRGYQDLYQLGMMNDLRHNIQNMIYIIPSNFLFGSSVSNKIRKDFLRNYKIENALIFEKEIFKHTGTNVVVCFFTKKSNSKEEILTFQGSKINKNIQSKEYVLDPKNQYRAGGNFEEFVNRYKAVKPLKTYFYLESEELEQNKGKFEVRVIDANEFGSTGYEKKKVSVNQNLHNKIKSNILFVRTVDTGKMNGRAGLYETKKVFGVEGILVSRAKYRTHPIQIFMDPMSYEEQILLKDYANLLLENFRDETDSEFMTTYKYSSSSEYIRKYLGLSQIKKIIQTFPTYLSSESKQELEKAVKNKDIGRVLSFVKKTNTKDLKRNPLLLSS